MKHRSILHADVNNFYASVAILSNPELKNVPLAVCGNPEKRHGIVLAKNIIAKSCGVKTGEAIWLAKQKCRDLVTVLPDYRRYTEISRKIFDIYTSYTSEVESFGLDECWLDVTGSSRLFGDPIAIAYRIKDQVKKETGLTVSVGVSFTKTFAKLGSDLKKPDAVSVVSPENFRVVAWRLPVQDMLNVGRSTEQKLAQRNILTIGDLANTKKEELIRLFGKFGESLWLAANGADEDPVKCYVDRRVPESVGNGSTTSEDICNSEDAKSLIFSLTEVIATRLRGYHMFASGVALSLRDANLHWFTRQEHLPSPTNCAKEIAETALKILKENYDFENMPPLRTLTITAIRLLSEDESVQSYLFEEEKKEEKLESKVDLLRQKYGYGILKRGVNLDSKFSCDAREVEDDFVPFGKEKGGFTE